MCDVNVSITCCCYGCLRSVSGCGPALLARISNFFAVGGAHKRHWNWNLFMITPSWYLSIPRKIIDAYCLFHITRNKGDVWCQCQYHLLMLWLIVMMCSGSYSKRQSFSKKLQLLCWPSLIYKGRNIASSRCTIVVSFFAQERPGLRICILQ